MRLFATYVLRGQWQAALTIAACALLSLLLPPFGYLSSAAAALVTLARGPRAGLLTIAIASALVGVMATVSFGNPLLALGLLLVVWLPAWLLAYILGQTHALSWSVLTAVAMGWMVVIGAYVFYPSPAQWWQEYYLAELLPAMRDAGMVVEMNVALEQRLATVARFMTGGLTAFAALGLLLSLLLARYWQALLERPGAFAAEFRALRLGATAASVTGVMLLLSLVDSGGLMELAGNLLVVSAVAFLLQGLALAHAAAFAFGVHGGWLFAFYALIFILPQLALMVIALGWLDNWVHIRRRLPERGA